MNRCRIQLQLDDELHRDANEQLVCITVYRSLFSVVLAVTLGLWESLKESLASLIVFWLVRRLATFADTKSHIASAKRLVE